MKEQEHVDTRGQVKEQAWVDPEIAEALTIWGEEVERAIGEKFVSRAEMLRTFIIINLGLKPRPVRVIRTSDLSELMRNRGRRG